MSTVTKKKKKSQKKSEKRNNKRRLVVLSLITIIFVASLIAVIVVVNRPHEPLHYSFDKNVAEGIDVSSHNGKIDWQAVSQEVDFAFIRVGYRGYANGSMNADKRAKANLKGANKANVPVGVYFYSQAVNEEEAEEEARFALNAIRRYDISLPVVIDFEYAFSNGAQVGRLSDAALSKREITKIIKAFCKTVRQAGYTPAVYASSYIYRSHLSARDLGDDVVIWVADYNKNVTYAGHYDIWQYSEKGECSGVSSKYVDRNYWYTKG